MCTEEIDSVCCRTNWPLSLHNSNYYGMCSTRKRVETIDPAAHLLHSLWAENAVHSFCTSSIRHLYNIQHVAN